MSSDLEFEQPDWRGDVHDEPFNWNFDNEVNIDRDELVEEGTLVDWGMVIDAIHKIRDSGLELTKNNVMNEVQAQVDKMVEDTCRKWEEEGRGYNEDGRFIPNNEDFSK